MTEREMGFCRARCAKVLAAVVSPFLVWPLRSLLVWEMCGIVQQARNVDSHLRWR